MTEHKNTQKRITFISLFFSFCLIISAALGIFTLAFSADSSNNMSNGDAAVTAFSGTTHKNNEVSIDVDGPSLRVIALPASGSFGLTDATKKLTIKASDVGQVFGVTLDNKSQPNIYVAATSAYGIALVGADGKRIKKGAKGAQFMSGQFGSADPSGGPNSIWRIDGSTGKVSLFANVSYKDLKNTPAALGGLAFDPVSQQIYVADRTTGMIHRFALDGSEKGTYDHGEQGLQAASQTAVTFDQKNIADITSDTFDTTNPKTWGYAPEERRVFALAVHANRLYYSVAGSHIWSVGIAADGSFATDTRLEVDISPVSSGTEVSSIAFDDKGFMYVAERGFPTGNYDFMQVADNGHQRVTRFTPKTSASASPYWEANGDDYAIGMPSKYQNADGGVDLICGPTTLWATGERLLDPGDNSTNFSHIDGLQGNDAKLVEPDNTPPKSSWFVNYYDQEANADSRGHMGAIVIMNDCQQAAAAAAAAGGAAGGAGGAGAGAGGGAGTPPTETGIPPTETGNPPTETGNPPTDGGYPPPDGGYPPSTTGGGYPPSDGIPPYVECPPGTYFVGDACVPPPYCPPYTYFYNGYCVYIDCPYGYVLINGVCVAPPIYCPYGTVFINGICVPYNCPSPLILDSYGYCRCPDGSFYSNGGCVAYNTYPVQCPADQLLVNGKCVKRPCPIGQDYINGLCVPHGCPYGQHYVNGSCIKNECPVGQHMVNGQCEKLQCPAGQLMMNGKCTATSTKTALCPDGSHMVNGKCTSKPAVNVVCAHDQELKNGQCVTKTITCPHDQMLKNGKCEPKTLTCPRDQEIKNGKCVPKTITCPHDQVLKNGKCVPKTITCPRDQELKNGKCVPKTITCPHDQVLKNGKCVPKIITITCPQGQVLKNGKCVPRTITCPQGQILKNGHCITPPIKVTCPSGTYYKHGHCVPIHVYHPPVRVYHPPVRVYHPPVIHVQPYTPHVNVYYPPSGGGGAGGTGGGCH